MAIKQRKQVTGTTEQINAYAGVEGQLVWDKTKKKWVGMSGTAGTNYPMASERHQHSIANVTDLQKKLDEKASKTELTNGLAGKADKSHTHAVADVTNLQVSLDNRIPKVGTRGNLAGWSASTAFAVSEGNDIFLLNREAKDSQYFATGHIRIYDGLSGDTWTKVVKMAGGDVALGTNWSWVGGEAPELVFPCFLVCHWNQDKGIAGIVKGVA